MKPQKHSKVFSPSKSALWLNCYLSTIFTNGTVATIIAYATLSRYKLDYEAMTK